MFACLLVRESAMLVFFMVLEYWYKLAAQSQPAYCGATSLKKGAALITSIVVATSAVGFSTGALNPQTNINVVEHYVDRWVSPDDHGD